MLEGMSAPDAGAVVPRRFLNDSTVFRWENLTLRSDLILTLPIAICLGVGIAVGHPAAGMLAAGGAANTGFGQKHSIDESQLLPMIFVTFGMAFAGFVGVVLGHENLLLVVAAALWAFGYGMLTARPDGYSWVGQQCVITFLVASEFPAPLKAAVAEGLLLFAGGAVQLLVSSVLLHLFGDLRARLFQLTRYLGEEQAALRSALIETAESVRQLRFAESALPVCAAAGFHGWACDGDLSQAALPERLLDSDDGAAGVEAGPDRYGKPGDCADAGDDVRGDCGELLPCAFAHDAGGAGELHGAVCVAGVCARERELCAVLDGHYWIYSVSSFAESGSGTAYCGAANLLYSAGGSDCAVPAVGDDLV